jgi:hypothetical protein
MTDCLGNKTVCYGKSRSGLTGKTRQHLIKHASLTQTIGSLSQGVSHIHGSTIDIRQEAQRVGNATLRYHEQHSAKNVIALTLGRHIPHEPSSNTDKVAKAPS